MSAKEYTTDRIRNVAVLGHGGSGKTTLIDALCWVTGTTNRKGRAEDGTAVTMFSEEERAHGISLQTAVAHAEWLDTKINLLDTPGYLDFTGEALAATRAADGAVITVGAVSGVEVGTEKVWEYCEERGLPRMFFISMMDKENADFHGAYEEIKAQLTDKVIPVEIPVGQGEDFRGIINLFSGKAHIYTSDGTKGEYDEEEVPDELQAQFEEWRTELFESIATTDDTLLEAYLEGGTIDRDQAIAALKSAMLQGEMYPLFSGAPEKAWGTRALLSKLVELMPSPAEAPSVEARRPDGDEVVELNSSDDASFSALVFKTASEPHVGELSLFRSFGGVITSGQDVANPNREATERLASLAIPMGKERREVPRLHAGDIGVVTKLRDTHTNDTLCSPADPVILSAIAFPDPDASIAVRAASRKDEDRLGAGLAKLREEDPTFSHEFNPELRQTIIRGMGELHLQIQMERLERKYGVKVTTEPPRIPYRETIRQGAEGHGRHKKQTGGRGQFGDCKIRLKPKARGEGYEFVDSIVGGRIPNKFIPSVDKGIQEAAQKGILAGYPVVDFEAEVFDGQYHSVDSSDVAFQVAGSLAFQDAAKQASPVLIEPIMEVEVVTPEEYVGDVMGDLNQRRGKVLGMDPEGNKTRVRALVPEAELYKYGTALRSMTQGRAMYRASFRSYEEVPPHVAEKVIEEAEAQRAS